MNKIFAVSVFAFILFTTIFPQESSFYDAPLGGGIGYNPGWIMPKVDGVNSILKNLDFPIAKSGGMYTSGISGFLYLGILKNFRIGGFGYSGLESNSGQYPVPVLFMNDAPSPIENRQTDYSISGGGLTFEYTLPFIKDIAVSAGISTGRGSLNIKLYRNNGGLDWQTVISSVANYRSNYLSLNNSFWLVSPTLNIEIPAYHMLCFRIGAGYQFTFGSNWTYDNDQNVSNAPSNINGNSFFIQTGIYVGLFSF